MKARADFFCHGDLVVDTAAILKYVRMVEDRSATGHRQFRQAYKRAVSGGLGGARRPDPVMDLQPGEEVIVLARRQISGHRLFEMMVRVHESGQHDLSR